MKNNIHFEDNLFYLNLLMKGLRDGFSLSIDGDYFLDKSVEDLWFIDSSLGKTFTALMDNANLIKRSEYLHSLLKSKNTFADLLQDILSRKLLFSEVLEEFFPQLELRQKKQREDIGQIRQTLKKSQETVDDREDLITNEELEILMKPEEEEV